jgi:ATP-binding protein involved in chromosome partitioning
VFFKSKDTVSEQDVLKALSQVQDPDLRKDIVTLGFIKELKIKGGEVSFSVELTTPACPVKDQLKKECEERVKAIPGVQTVSVRMTANVRSTTTPGGGGNRISLPTVKNVIAVASGKGGVGKSTVTINLTVALAQTGARVGLLDADIYGPSIPMMLGSTERPVNADNRLFPVVKDGIKMMSMGFLIPENQPVVWRGPMVHGALTQFMTQVEWGDLDYLIIDMPPGTGDAQLTISQTAPLSGAIIVTTPQEVSLLDARRGAMMFSSVNIPILGVVENMAGFSLPGSSAMVNIFGKGGGSKFAAELGVPLLSSLPIDPRVTEGGDSGRPIVAFIPDAPISQSFRDLAGSVAARLSILQAEASGNFKPMALKWQ